VKKLLGQGGQGEVYLVEGAPAGKQAVKWYNSAQATEQQKDALRKLVQRGAPKNGGHRFIWPIDLVTASGSQEFGYLMPLIDTSRFAELGEIQARRKPQPTFSTLCEISRQIASSYQALHLDGSYYCDLSLGNLMFDPTNGDVLICDNDNVGVNKVSEAQVLGTMEFMAPEVVRGAATPSSFTDQYSLAVLLFNLWMWHHPLHGLKEYNIRCWDLPAKRRIYGEEPVFIFDPTDKSNELPNDVEYSIASKRWRYCPPSLQQLFTRSFTVGLRDTNHRVTEGEWGKLFQRLREGRVDCPTCRANNLWDSEYPALHCWNCRNKISLVPCLKFVHGSTLLMSVGTKLLARHLVTSLLPDKGSVVLGEVVVNPTDPRITGLRNLTTQPWTATFSDGGVKEVPPQRAVPITPGVSICFPASLPAGQVNGTILQP